MCKYNDFIIECQITLVFRQNWDELKTILTKIDTSI